MSIAGGFSTSPVYQLDEQVGAASRFTQVYYGETILDDYTTGLRGNSNYTQLGQVIPLPGQKTKQRNPAPNPQWANPPAPFTAILEADEASAYYYLVKRIRCILKLPNDYSDTTSEANWRYGPYPGDTVNCFFSKPEIVNEAMQGIGTSSINPNVSNSFGTVLFSSILGQASMNAKVETLLQNNNNPGNQAAPNLVTGVRFGVRRSETPAVNSNYRFAEAQPGWSPGSFTGSTDADDGPRVLDIYNEHRNLLIRGTEFICIISQLPYMYRPNSETSKNEGNGCGIGLYIDGFYSNSLEDLIPYFPLA